MIPTDIKLREILLNLDSKDAFKRLEQLNTSIRKKQNNILYRLKRWWFLNTTNHKERIHYDFRYIHGSWLCSGDWFLDVWWEIYTYTELQNLRKEGRI